MKNPWQESQRSKPQVNHARNNRSLTCKRTTPQQAQQKLKPASSSHTTSHALHCVASLTTECKIKRIHDLGSKEEGAIFPTPVVNPTLRSKVAHSTVTIFDQTSTIERSSPFRRVVEVHNFRHTLPSPPLHLLTSEEEEISSRALVQLTRAVRH